MKRIAHAQQISILYKNIFYRYVPYNWTCLFSTFISAVLFLIRTNEIKIESSIYRTGITNDMEMKWLQSAVTISSKICSRYVIFVLYYIYITYTYIYIYIHSLYISYIYICTHIYIHMCIYRGRRMHLLREKESYNLLAGKKRCLNHFLTSFACNYPTETTFIKDSRNLWF